MHVFVSSALWKIAELPKPVPAVRLAERAHQSPVGRDSGDPHRADGSSSSSGGTLQHPQHFPQETVASAPLSAPPQHARPHNDLGKVNISMLQFQPFVCVNFLCLRPSTMWGKVLRNWVSTIPDWLSQYVRQAYLWAGLKLPWNQVTK